LYTWLWPLRRAYEATFPFAVALLVVGMLNVVRGVAGAGAAVAAAAAANALVVAPYCKCSMGIAEMIINIHYILIFKSITFNKNCNTIYQI